LAAAIVAVFLNALPASAAAAESIDARATRALAPFPPRAAVIFDPLTGHTLYGLHAEEKLPPASLAKMMTALLAAERLRPSDPITISHLAALAQADQIRWPEGVTFTADQVMHGMMMESSNGAAVALAQRFAGSIRGFIRMAKARAAELGATETNILDPAGLDRIGQYSTAHDLALMTAALLREPWVASAAATKVFELPWSDGNLIAFHTLDRFLLRYPGAVGMKNGFTSRAGNCLAAAATRGGRTMIVVVLNDGRVFDSAAELMDIAFETIGIDPRAPLTHEDGMIQAAGNGVLATTPPHRKASRGGIPASVWLVLVLMSAYGARFRKVKVRTKRRRMERRRELLSRSREAVERHELRALDWPAREEPLEVESRERSTV
jgi:serine-type D-Ala-D-Ala carboxypeptidase (penicillin-binding protein 5/6)